MKIFNFLKRIPAAVLAAALVLSISLVPAIAATVSHADKPVQLSFNGTTALNVAVIRGVAVTVNATNVENRAPLSNPLKIVKNYEDGSQREDHTEYFHVSGDKSKMSLRAFLRSELEDGKKQFAAESNYTISSNYGTMKWKADFVSQTDNNGRAEGTMELVDASGLDGLNILTDSAVKMKYENGQFTLIPDSATGIFRDYDATISFSESEHIKGTSTVNEQFTLYMREKQVTAGSSEPQLIQRVFTFQPRQTWTDPDTGDTRYDIREGSIYEIRYQFKTSYPLTLTVMDPEKVLLDVVTQATSTDLKNNVFVKTSDTGNTNNYITGNLSLSSTVTMYNQEVQLTWEWIPNDPNATEAQKNAINIVTNAGKPATAEITRQNEDLSGVLRVKALYSSSKLNTDVTGGYTTEDLPITIHGKGTLPEIVSINGYVGHGVNPDTTLAIKTADQTLPTEIQLDAYRNEVVGYAETSLPYSADFFVTLGQENGRATQMYIDLLKPDGTPYTGGAVTAVLSTSKATTNYTFGTAYSNSGSNAVANATLKIYAQSDISGLRLRFRFMVTGPSGDREETDARKEIALSVSNSTPDRTAALTALSIKSNNLAIDGFTFNQNTYKYEVSLPYTTNSIVLSPTKYKNSQEIIGLSVEYQDESSLWQEAGPDEGWTSKDSFSLNKEWIFDWADQAAAKGYSIRSGKTLALSPVAGKTLRVTFTVRAQHPNQLQTYVVDITRQSPSDNSWLSSIKLVDSDGKNWMTSNIVKGQMEYTIEVPFKTKSLQVLPVCENKGAYINNSANAGESDYSPVLGKREGMVFDSEDWWTLARPSADPTAPYPDNTLTVRVHAENGISDNDSLYTFHVVYKEPSTDSTLSSLRVTDGNNKTITYTPTFHKNMETGDYYELTVPFSTDRVKITAVPSYTAATHQLKVADLTSGQPVLTDMSRTNPSVVMLPILYTDEEYYTATVIVTAEDMGTKTEYPLRIHRTPPSTDASLSSLVIADQNGKDLALTTDFSFHPDNLTYYLSVPFEVEKVSFTPTATFSNVSKITINSWTAINGQKSTLYKLNDALTETQYDITVYPEDASAAPKVYTVIITRKAPSTDARLKGLVINGAENFKPLFLPDTLEYTADVTIGQTGVTITATPNNENATMVIRGVNAVNGQPTELIELMDLTEEIHIIVTAQDGLTQRDYKVTLTDLNKIERSSNADLKSLDVLPGVISPNEFQPSVTAYEVAVTEDTASVKLVPEAADAAATIEVFAGSKKIGDEQGNYAQAIQDGENEFTVKVTAPDNSKTKEYAVTVYRNDEEKNGVLTPITADDVDFETSNPIIVDITKYTRVAADVFNTLKEEYPDKTIIFEGNDYSLSFKGSEITKTVPITTIFDFGLKFTTPDADNISSLLTLYPENALLQNVYVYFNYHGNLPAPATLSLSIGQKYGNRTLYWHYYNAERSRIDYYGSVNTNVRGNFNLQLTHMSTYIISTGIIYGSENLSGSIDLNGTGNKTNPNTAGSTQADIMQYTNLPDAILTSKYKLTYSKEK